MADSISSVFNDAYIAQQYENFRRDPDSVDESWRRVFRLPIANGDGFALPSDADPQVPVATAPLPAPVAASPPPAPEAPAEPPPAPVAAAEPQPVSAAAAPALQDTPVAPAGQPDQDFARRVVGVSRYLNSIRRYGYLAVQLDPLGSPPPGAVELTLEHYGITEADLELVTGDALGFPHLAHRTRRRRAAEVPLHAQSRRRVRALRHRGGAPVVPRALRGRAADAFAHRRREARGC